MVWGIVWVVWAPRILFGCLGYCLGGLGHCMGVLGIVFGVWGIVRGWSIV